MPPGPPVGVARHIYRVLGSYLPVQHDGVSAAEAGWNLMSAAARSYTRERLDVVGAADELTEAERLWRNMLASRPLAFSIVGELRAHEAAALSVLSRLTGLDLAKFDGLGEPGDPCALDGLQADWAAPEESHTCDIAAAARTAAGERVSITIEVEYVDTFSPTKLDPARYRVDGLAELVELGAGQFLRSALLTESVRGDGGFDKAVALLLCRADDGQARKVVAAVDRACATTGLTIALRTHEDLFDAAADEPALHDWAQAMRRRYLTS